MILSVILKIEKSINYVYLGNKFKKLRINGLNPLIAYKYMKFIKESQRKDYIPCFYWPDQQKLQI